MDAESQAASERLAALTERLEKVTGCFRLDLGAQRWWWSQSLSRFMGHEPGERAPAREFLLTHIPEDVRASLRRTIKRTQATGLPFTWSGQVVRPDQSHREVIIVGECELKESGEPAAITGYVLDVSLTEASTRDANWWIAGRGESAHTIRAMQLESATKDPPEIWPEELCVALNLCLDVDGPAAVLWGPQFRQFYNDAYRETITSTHPIQIGLPVADNWPEIWGSIGPEIESVGRTGVGRSHRAHQLCVLREGKLTENFFDYSLVPIRDRGGTTLGILCVVLDTTSERTRQRRADTRRELAQLGGVDLAFNELLSTAMRVLATNPFDVPFAAVYEFDTRSQHAVCIASYGLAVTSTALRDYRPEDDLSPWPFQVAVHAGRTIIDELGARYPNLFAGPWPDHIRQAAVSVLPGGRPSHRPYILVAGLSSRLLLNDDYLEFIERIGVEMAAVLDAARKLAAERERASNLAIALVSNRHIGAAIGVLMAFRNITEDQAFKLLRQTSQRTRRKLREVAEEVTRTGVLPESQP
ncbi:MAG TPA: ANTAR domain-containing protein [Frankiaceae bacterium]|jgi:PAS domain-containing protein|nr:ANTAR domain-containing protein [Frankiaceae bacterium]